MRSLKRSRLYSSIMYLLCVSLLASSIPPNGGGLFFGTQPAQAASSNAAPAVNPPVDQDTQLASRVSASNAAPAVNPPAHQDSQLAGRPAVSAPPARRTSPRGPHGRAWAMQSDPPRLVYHNDFEGWIGPEWSALAHEPARQHSGWILGRFGNQTVSLTLDDLPAHSTVTGSFDLYILDSWDGNREEVYAPDVWELRADQSPPLIHTSFSNWFDQGFAQSYPGTHPADNYPPGTGAVEFSLNPRYALYHIPFTVTHALDSLVLEFAGIGLQSRSDEGWGIDNIEVFVDAPSTDVIADFSISSPHGVEPHYGAAPHPIYFMDRSSAGDGTIETWQWDFGDGDTSDDSAPSHTYQYSGIYTPTLAVSSTLDTDSVHHGGAIHAGYVGGTWSTNQSLNSFPNWPGMAYNPDAQESLLVWAEWRGDYWGATAQRINQFGSPVGSLITLDSELLDIGESRAPVLAYLPAAERYLVVWADRRGGVPQDLYGQLIDSDGSLVGDSFVIQASGPNEYGTDAPTVQANPVTGEFLVAWVDKETFGGNSDVFARRVSPSGALLGDRVPIAERPIWTLNPELAVASDGSYLLTWMDDNFPECFGIWGRSVSSDLQVLGPPYPIYATPACEGGNKAAYDPVRDAFFVIWGAPVDDGVGRVIGRWVWRAGGVASELFDLTPAFGLNVQGHAVRYDQATGEMLVVWSDNRLRQLSLFGQLVGLEGPRNQLMPIVVANGNPIFPALADGPLLAWRDQTTETIQAANFTPILADFAADTTAGPAPLTVSFTDQSAPAAAIEAWAWDFGDGASSTLQSPDHTYTQSGTYTVTLTIHDDRQRQVETRAALVHVGLHAATLDVSPQEIEVGGNSNATVTLLTADGNPVVGEAIELRAEPQDGFLIDGQAANGFVAIGPTNGAGEVTVPVSTAFVGTYTLTARSSSGSATSPPATVTFTPLPADAGASQLETDRTRILADGVNRAYVVATLRDQYNNPIPGKDVEIQTTGSNVTVVQPTLQTDRLGRVYAAIRSDTPQEVTVRAVDLTDSLMIAQEVTLAFVAGPADAAHSTFELAPATVVADGVSTATITATLRDGLGNPLAARLVQLVVTGSDNIVLPGEWLLSDANGLVVYQLASTRIEVKQVAVRDADYDRTFPVGEVAFVNGQVDPARSTISAGPAQAPADGSGMITLAAVLRDSGGNPVPGVSVTFTTTATGVLITQPTGPSDPDGRVEGALTSTIAQPVIVLAVAGGTTLSSQAQVRFRGHDITINQSGPDRAGLDQVVTYTVTLRNDNLMVADTIIVSDTLPPDFTYLSSTAGVDPEIDGQTLVWTFSSPLAHNASRTFEVHARTTADEAAIGRTVVNRLEVSAAGTDENPANNVATRSTTLVGVDLAVTLSAVAESNEGQSHRLAAAGFPVTYTITVQNTGLTAARDTVLTDTLPVQLTAIDQNSAFPFSITGASAVWQLGQVDPGQVVTIELTGQVAAQALGALTNRVTARTSSAEDALFNNQASRTLTVEAPAARPSVLPAAPLMVVGQGESATLLVTLRNTGLAALDQIEITLPPHIAWVSVQNGGLTSLPPGQSATLTIEAAPGVAQTPGYYRDFVLVAGDNAPTVVIALTVNVRAPVRPLAVTVENNQGARVPGALVTLVKQAPSVVVTQGVTQTYHVSAQTGADGDGVATFAGIELGAYDYSLAAADHEPASGVLTVVAGSDTQTATLTMIGLPRLVLAPDTPVIKVLPGQHAAKEIQIHNAGAAPLTNVVIASPAGIPWVTLGSPAAIPLIGPGESIAFTVFASPPDPLTGDIFQGYVTVTADGGRSAQAALTVQIAPVTPQNIQVQVASGTGQPVTSGGSITLIRQEPTVQITQGVTTTFNQQFSQPLNGAGLAAFSDLPPGEYNYLVFADGYEQGAATLTVEPRLPADPIQVVTAQVRPDPFRYSWTVTPIQQGYDISLVLTYDTESPAPGVIIPARYWSFYDCDQQIDDIITIYNPTDIPLDLNNLALNVPGVNVAIGAHPTEILPHESIQVPVRATQVGTVSKGVALATFNYQAAADPYVTFDVEPGSRLDPVEEGDIYSTTFELEPVIYSGGVDYLIEVTQPVSMTWATVEIGEFGPMQWTDDTSIPITLTADLQTPLENGVHIDRAPIRVVGSDGSYRDGAIVIRITKTDDGMQIFTGFELGPIPMVIKGGANSGFIHPSLGTCDEPGDTGGGGGGGWVWGWVGGALVGRPGGGGGGGGGGAPSFPQYVPPPVYGNDHQQVRVQIDQRVMLEGEGFHAVLSLENTSPSPLDVVSVDIAITDVVSGELRNSAFIITPTVPTDLGRVEVGESAGQDWVILPDDLELPSQAGEKFNVKAIITYTWQGTTYTLETIPEEITVLPAPDLEITYELPLEEVPCTVFLLKAIFYNKGPGAARNLRFSSAQPRLVDKENSLPIDFAITRTFVDGVDQGQSLNLTLGDLAPGATTEVIFLLEASRPGKFVEFASDYRQANYQGLLLRPLISKIETRFVREGTLCGARRVSVNPIAGDNVYDSGVDANIGQQRRVLVGGPIDVGSGNYLYSVNDLTLQMRSGQLAFRRIYSRDRLGWLEDNIFGPGWTHNYNIRLYFNDVDDEGNANQIVLQHSNGSRQAFDRSGELYLPEQGLLAEIARTETAADSGIYTYTVVLNDQTRYEFDNDGVLRQIDRVAGDMIGAWNPLTLDYITREITITPPLAVGTPPVVTPLEPFTVTAHLLTQISDGTAPGARSLTFHYDDPDHPGLITEIHDQRGGSAANQPSARFAYDPAGQLVSATDLADETWTYTYTEQITALPPDLRDLPDDRQADLNGAVGRYLLTHIRDPLQHIVERQHFNAYGCAVEQYNGNDEVVVDITYERNQGDCATEDERRVVVADGRGMVKYFHYIGGGLTKVEFDLNGQTMQVQQEYDSGGRPFQMTDTNGRVTQQEWAPGGANLRKLTDAQGNITEYFYDGQPPSGGAPTLPPYNNLTTIRRANNAAPNQGPSDALLTTFEYADQRFPTLPTAMIDPEGNRLTFTYTEQGYLDQEIEQVSGTGQQVITKHVYDQLGQHIRMIANYVAQPGVAPENVAFDASDPDQNLVTTFGYDAIGQLIETIDPYGQRSTIAYDDAGRITRMIRNYENGIFNPDNPDRDIVIRATYDDAGRILTFAETVNATLDRVTGFAYDNANRHITETLTFEGRQTQIVYGYDAAGNQTRVHDRFGRDHLICYNILNLPARRIEHFQGVVTDPCLAERTGGGFSTDPDKDIVTDMVYDGAGNLVTTIDPLRRATFIVYDQLNRPIKTVRNAKDDARIDWSRQHADPNDARDPRSTGYAPGGAADRDQITERWFNRVGNLAFSRDTLEPDALYCYDRLDRPVRTVVNPHAPNLNPIDPEVPWRAGAEFSVLDTCRQLSQSYDGWGGTADTDLITSFEYDSLGRVVAVTDPRNVITRFGYDAIGRQTAMITNYSTAMPPAADQNITHQIDYGAIALGSGQSLGTQDIFRPVPAGVQPTRHTRLNLDRMGRERQVIANFQDGLFDPILPAQDVVQSYVYDGRGQVIGTSDSYGRTNTFRFEEFGRPTQVIENRVGGVHVPDQPNLADQDIVTNGVYDLGLLRSLQDTLGRTTSFAYDGHNRLILIDRNPVNGSYEESAADEDIRTRYAYDKAGRQVGVADALGRTNWTCYDSLDRPVKLVANTSRTLDALRQASPGSAGDPCSASYQRSADATRDVIARASYERDAQDNLLVTSSFDNRDTAGNVIQTLSTRTFYDALNRPIAQVHNYQDGAHGFDPNAGTYDPPDRDVISAMFYDKVGNIVRVVDAFGRETWRCYDKHNRLTAEIVNVADLPVNSAYLSVADLKAGEMPGPDSCDSSTADPAPDKHLISYIRYDASGRVIEITDPIGRRTAFAYDELDRVTYQVRNYQGSGDLDPQNLPAFDSLHPDWNVIQRTRYGTIRDETNKLVEVIDSIEYLNAQGLAQRTTRTVYDWLGRERRIIRNFQDGITPGRDVNVATTLTYDGAGNLRIQTNPNGAPTRFFYDKLDRLIELRDPRTHSTYTTYDGAGNVRSITDPLDHTTRFAYDGLDRQTVTTTPLDHSEMRYLDTFGHRLEQSDANDITTLLEHDALGRLTTVVENYHPGFSRNQPDDPDRDLETIYSYDVGGNLLGADLPRGAFSFGYDALNRRTTVDGPLTNVADIWTTTYHRDMRTIEQRDPNQLTQTLRYDDLGRLKRKEYSDPATHAVDFAYDGSSAERLQIMEDGWGPTVFGYDPLDRLTSVTDPDSNSVSYVYDAGGRRREMHMRRGSGAEQAAHYNYYDNDLLHTVTDWDGQTTEYVYDEADRLTGMTLPNNVDLSLDYDDDNRLTQVRYTQGGNTLMQIDYTAFDGLGNRLAATEQLQGIVNRQGQVAFVSDRDGDNEIFLADADGSNAHPLTDNENVMDFAPAWSPDGRQLAFTSLRNGYVDIYILDVESGVEHQITNDSVVQGFPTWSPDGRQIAFISILNGNTDIYVMNADGSGSHPLTSDPAIDSAPAWSPDGDRIAFTSNRDGDFEVYTMDLTGGDLRNLTNNENVRDFGAAWSPDGEQIAFTSNREGSPNIYIAGADGSNPLPITNTNLDKSGPSWSPDGNRIAYSTLSTTGTGGYEIFIVDLADLSNDNISDDDARESMAAWSPIRIGPISRTIAYDYDNRYRLTNADYTEGGEPLGSYVYEYDLMGNLKEARQQIVEQAPTSQSYTYNDANQLLLGFESQDGGRIDHTYRYDPAGNLIEDDILGGGTGVYTYDAENRLISYAEPGGRLSTYHYNGMGDRYARTVDGSTTNYLLDLNRELTEVLAESTGGQETWYLSGIDIIGQEQGGQWSYFGYDGLGSVRQVLDANGVFLSGTNFDPYGTPFERYGASGSSALGFTGEQTDPNGLLYLRARYYDPRHGAFLSRDPVEGVMERAMSRNGYSYVEGNPVNLTDPSGRCPLCIVALVGATFFFGAEWYRQVQDNQMQGMSFWDAVSYKNLNIGRLVGAAAIGGIAGVVGAMAGGLVLAGAASFAGTLAGSSIGIQAAYFLTSLAASGVAGGLASRATINLLTGQNITQGLFEPKDMLLDAVFGIVAPLAGPIFRNVRGRLSAMIANMRAGPTPRIIIEKPPQLALPAGDIPEPMTITVDRPAQLALPAGDIPQPMGITGQRPSQLALPAGSSSALMPSDSPSAITLYQPPSRAIQPYQFSGASIASLAPVASAAPLAAVARSNSNTCANSFSADTPVATAQGDVPIDTIEVGDHVLAYDEATGATGSYTVTAVLVHTDPVLVHLTLDDEQIETTPEHPFYTQEREWVDAGELKVGDHVRQADGDYGQVQAVSVEQRWQTMYNLTVAVAHTFFVGDGEWLVHNCPPDDDDLPGRPWQYADDKQPNRLPSWVTHRDKKFGVPLVGIGLRKPVNFEYRGRNLLLPGLAKLYPLGVDFDKQAFPIFDRYTLTDKNGKAYIYVHDRLLTGNPKTDSGIAEKALNPAFKPKIKTTRLDVSLGGTWHHVQDGRTLILLPTDLHDVTIGGVGHTGGEAVIDYYYYWVDNKK